MCGAWQEFLAILGSSPHAVTRVDLAVDLAMDGADLVDAMRARYPSGMVNLGRKSISTTLFLSVRPDGRETGTWYAGHRTKARATARVYDKAHQLWERDGTITLPRARVEVTARKGYGATLRDAALPEALFWHIASRLSFRLLRMRLCGLLITIYPVGRLRLVTGTLLQL